MAIMDERKPNNGLITKKSKYLRAPRIARLPYPAPDKLVNIITEKAGCIIDP